MKVYIVFKKDRSMFNHELFIDAGKIVYVFDDQERADRTAAVLNDGKNKGRFIVIVKKVMRKGGEA